MHQDAQIAPRVAIITSTFPFGPAEAFLFDELACLAHLGCALTIFPAVPRSRHRFFLNLNAVVQRFSLLSPATLRRAYRGFRRNPRGAYLALATVLRARNRATTKLKNLMLFPTALAVADEVCMRRIEHIHAYWLAGPSTVALIASLVSGVKWSFTAHSWDVFMENNLIAEKLSHAQFGRTISELARRGILRHASGVPSPRVEVVHLGITVPPRSAIAKAEPGHSIRLLCPAYFVAVKGHKYLIAALRKVADLGISYTCVLAGDGPLRRSLSKQIKRLRLQDSIYMPGMLPHEVLLRRLQSGEYDAVVLGSVETGEEFEGIPAALIEAMAAGIPCIATRTGAIPELVDEECGILVNQRDPEGLAAAISGLARDTTRRAMLGKRAGLKVAASFDVRASAHALLCLMTGG